MRPRAWLLAFVLAGCADDECPTIGCEDTSQISFPVGLVIQPYDLVVVAEVGMFTARCLQPSAPEADANPPELRCDRSGFELTGGEFARMRELQITVTDVESGEVLAAGNVDAGVVDELAPNGPDCPGLCFVRNGELRAQGDD
ncbi:MAG: hypothetical protein IAG13_10015 [Deltaproteobacteria bacterium]|nr:hypothetical protein [Nannocystaceae bacterium]